MKSTFLAKIAATVTIVILAATGCGDGPDDNSSNGGKSDSTAAASTNGHKAIGRAVTAQLPDWSEKSPEGGDPAQAPAKYHISQTFSGSNEGKSIYDGTIVELKEPGKGMLYRYACNATLMDSGKFMQAYAGTVDANGEPEYYENTIVGTELSGAHYFNWGWLSNELQYNPAGGFIRLMGDCKWEVKIIYQKM